MSGRPWTNALPDYRGRMRCVHSSPSFAGEENDHASGGLTSWPK